MPDRLTLSLLDPLQAAASDNPALQGLWYIVGEWVKGHVENPAGTPRMSRKQSAEYLLDAMIRVGWYLTDAPPRGVQNMTRFAAMEKIAAAVGAELEKLGLRSLTGPTNWGKIGDPHVKINDKWTKTGKDRSYWLEFLDPDHRPGFVLSTKFESWLTSGGDQSFWDFVGSADPFSYKVKYYGENPKAAKRRVKFNERSNLLEKTHPTQAGLFHTGEVNALGEIKLETCFSGKGWCIFVVDMEDNIYAHKHVEGKYHHSTFLSGFPVTAAGEMVVDNGKIRVITAKSGHYKPSLENLKSFVTKFPEIPRDAIIRPDLGDEAGRGRPRFYRAGQFRWEGTSAPVLKKDEVMAVIPAWAVNASSKKVLDKIA